MSEQYSPGEATLAAEATDYYSRSQLGSCFSHMKKLHSMRPADPKVLANMALIEFIHQNNMTCSDEYLSQLRKAAILACSPIFVTGDSDIHAALRPVSPTAEQSIISIHYNYALVLFYQRQYVRSERMIAGLLGIATADASPASIEFPLAYWLQQLNSSGEGVGNPVKVEVIEMLREIARPLRVFRLRACLLTGRIRIAQEEASQLSQSSNTSDDKSWDTSKSLEYARAQLSYLQQDHTKTVKRLNTLLPSESTSSPTSVEWESSLVWNNLSLTYFRAGHLGLAMLEARAALRRTKSLADEATTSATEVRRLVNRTPLHQLSASRHYELLYNTGVQLLLGQKHPETAFNALLTVVKAYPRNPRLWLRLAECCVKVHRPDNLNDWSAESRASCLLRAVGEGAARKLIIGADVGPPKSSSTGSTSTSEANLSLEFAVQCLRNAAFLLPRPPIDLDTSTSPPDQLPVDRLRSALLKWAAEQARPTFLCFRA
ncbi:CCR4-NOT transcription complex subunit [Echinococcus granulosus]|uniref:CCR4-NOT transcription complex subunit 10 n=1 Tax=Echinococcus granulosus TaxID=6210 RepID=W6U7S7_ECHGR|nr:CCR4-NOT transcription complex subunit [Echinococcus granulosus]EUB57273.1 CCR4-NOT transcription complex subunit [Echinococcus granulosus]